jgi:hypothetical protein
VHYQQVRRGLQVCGLHPGRLIANLADSRRVSIATLEEMVALMGKYQLARDLTPEEIASIVTFLSALKGDIPEQYIAVPVLPESGPETAGFAQTQTQ